MVRWRDEQQNHPARRARRTAATRLGAEAAGLETAGHCRSPRGDARCCEPMAQAGTRARHRGRAAPPSGAWSATAAHRRTTGAAPALVERGPEAYGFRGQIWTCKRVAEVIRRAFGVSYHPAHVSRLLHPPTTVSSSPRSAPVSATPPLSRCGGASAGRPSKKSGRGRTDHRLGRPIGLLLAPHGGAHLGATGADATVAGAAHPRPSGRHQWHHPRRPPLPSCRPRSRPITPTTSCASCASCASCCARSAASCWSSGMARRSIAASPSRPARQGLPAPRRRQTPAPGTAARLCARAESR